MIGGVLFFTAQTILGSVHIIKLARDRFKKKHKTILSSIYSVCVLSNDFMELVSKKRISITYQLVVCM